MLTCGLVARWKNDREGYDLTHYLGVEACSRRREALAGEVIPMQGLRAALRGRRAAVSGGRESGMFGRISCEAATGLLGGCHASVVGLGTEACAWPPVRLRWRVEAGPSPSLLPGTRSAKRVRRFSTLSSGAVALPSPVRRLYLLLFVGLSRNLHFWLLERCICRR